MRNWKFEMELKHEEERKVSKEIDWYQRIEEPIRKEVKLLRDNGFNTECSCGHEMYVQCEYLAEGEIQRLHNLLFNQGYRNYSITVMLQVIDAYNYSSLEIRFLEGGKK